MLPDTFHFLRAEYLLLLPIFAITMALFYRYYNRTSSRQKICATDLLPHLQLKETKTKPLKNAWTALIIAAIIIPIILAGPAWRRLPKPLFQPLKPLLFLLDLSTSMTASDIKPSRLVQAK
ncbi:hypothetical protein ACQZV8_16570, partial [Magnetococcales bacterium HHB-1]